MHCEIKNIGTTEFANILYISVQLICVLELQVATKGCSKKSVLKKAFLHNSSSALVIKKCKKCLWRSFILVKL